MTHNRKGRAWHRVTLAWALLPAMLNAQTVGPGVPQGAPSGAQLLQQLEMAVPPRSLDLTEFNVEQSSGRGTASALPPSAPFLLQHIVITHNAVFDTPTLLALVADAQGKNTTFPELAELAARITHYYRNHGYPLSRAIIPAQTISAALGEVSVRVVEARYGQIELANTSRVRSGLLQATLDPLNSGQDINDLALRNVLLLLSDIPGIGVKAIYKPGQYDGTSDLSFAITPLPSVSGHVVLDNYGSAYTGQNRLSTSVTVSNPLHQGDTLNASTLDSGSGLSYWRLAYEATLNGLGSRAGASLSSLDYALGGRFAPLHASGNATLQSVWAKHPMVRTQELNVYAQAQYDGLQTHDRSDDTVARPDRTVRTATLSLSGDVHSGATAPSLATWKLAWTGGQLRLADSAANVSAFAKWNLNLAYLRSVGVQSTVYLSYTGQRAQNNLDPSQKMSAGGPYTVRAYAMGAVSGDSADLFTAEWQHTLGRGAPGHWQVVAFVDSARVTINHISASGLNTAMLQGAGIGLNWTGPNGWTAHSAIARPLGEKSALVTDRSARLWLELRKAM